MKIPVALLYRPDLVLGLGPPKGYYRLISFSEGTFLRGVQGNPNKFPILVQGDAVDGMSPI